jgi:hypothetical protein
MITFVVDGHDAGDAQNPIYIMHWMPFVFRLSGPILKNSKQKLRRFPIYDKFKRN